MFELSLQVNRGEFLKDPRKRISRGLQMAGQAYQSEMRRYPPAPPNEGLRGTGTRMNDLAKSVNYRVVEDGTTLELLGPAQTKYALFGTGIYGPKGQPIVPVSSPFLVWRVTDMSHPLAGKLVFAKSVSGFIWQGKLELLKLAIKEAFFREIKSD